MFTDEQKRAYNSIKAPEELLEKIKSSAEEENKVKPLFKNRFSKIIAAAACVVFVSAAVFASFGGGDVNISVNNTPIEEDATVVLSQNNGIALARESSNGEVTINIELTKDALISVNGGNFDVIGEDTNLTEFSAEESVEIIWRTDGAEKSTMTVDYGRKTCELVLEYNGEWVVTRK